MRVEQWGVVVDIKAYIGEATEYDKKEALEDRRPKSWLKSVSAFALSCAAATALMTVFPRCIDLKTSPLPNSVRSIVSVLVLKWMHRISSPSVWWMRGAS